jgi:hypothetical protein
MKVPKSVFKLLENKYVLYFVLFLAVSNLLGYMVVGNMNAVILFILIGGLMTFFSKNMIIVLSVPLVLTSVLLVGNRVSEGFDPEVKDENSQGLAAAVADAASGADTSAPTDVTIKKDKKIESTATDNTALNAAVTTPLDNEPEGATTDTKPENMSLYKKKNNRIDYASTLEDAYGDLNNILGKDGIKNLTKDTQKLMDQQMELAQALKGMAPLIGDAKKMLSGMDISGLTDMAKNFGQNIPK